ncbi:hypothetical protein [Sphingobacterium griseoflavum]|uniref:Fibronectin type-III domain-containing protein n=1 Tax=Sphingobacterium griseoflavum TaxID=1474952 RepID=A0ABQ3HV29_9SPHI|nr:hypothetical protein [Sphingobacterium griseoflavum]GHE31185.1 hypothetical protein GCM10017764_12840 [Sphingobacterium griseoflavum]
MKYIRVKASFFRYPDDKLEVRAAHIITCLKESDTFTSLDPPLEILKEAYRNYYQKVVDARGKDREKAALKRASKRRLADILQQLAFYVNRLADGKLSLLYSSGFPVLAKKAASTIPARPLAAFVKDGRNSGEVEFGFKPVGRDIWYAYGFALINRQGKAIWGKTMVTTRSFKNFQDGFTAGQYICFRVRARNKHGHSAWTNPIKWLVR